MFTKNSKIDSFAALARELREYAELRLRYYRVDLTQRVARLLTVIAMAIILLAVVSLAVIFVACSVALLLAPYIGGLAVSCALVAVAGLVAGWVVYLLRRPLLLRPITAVVARILLDDNESLEPIEEDEL